MCRRSIEPRYGLWTLPAGFLENGETVSEGVKREAFEEARADVDLLDLYALFSLPQISQVYLIFRSRLISPSFSAGEETLELRLFSEEEIPWDAIAFKAIEKGLELYFRDRSKGKFPLHIETIELSLKRKSQ